MNIRALPRSWVIDASIAGVVTAIEVAGTYSSRHWHGNGQEHVSSFWYIPVFIGGLSLLARRRFPVEVLAVTLAMGLWGGRLNVWPVWLALIVAYFNAVVAKRRTAAIASAIIGVLVSAWPPWLIGAHGHTSAAEALWLLFWLTVLLSVAELFRVRSQRAAEIESRRAAEARRAASEQRLAIARDLHDVVAHNISVINVQAKTALHLMDRQPERAREALTAIHDVSRQALAELRSVLGVLRTSDGSGAPLAPSPGLDRLGELASGTAGIAVRVVTDGAPRPVPAGVDVAAYRIVQEALTNSVRHSGGRTAVVRLRYDPDALTVSVEDDGRGLATGSAVSGNGVAGMTERARALGGSLEAGPRPGGGFRVRAYLPAGGGS